MIEFIEAIYSFVFHYPLIMAFFLMIAGVCYQLFREREPDIDHLPSDPMVSILIPCHNEEDCIIETIQHLDKQEYENFEIIAINDGSTDQTLPILQKMAESHPKLRLVNLSSNQGKGMAMNMGLMVSRGEYLVCIDADALLDPRAVKYFLWHFLKFPRVGAVTGNPRVRNRTSIIGKIQVGEFSSIVGMIKRSQRVIGKVYTVSGVIAAFRKRALMTVNLWSTDMVTEDIDVSWKLQTRLWDIRYEPRALCWILMPETLKGLWSQRLRWSQGGSEVLKKFAWIWTSWKQRRIWPVYLEYMLSVTWAYLFLFTIIVYLSGKFFAFPPGIEVRTLLPGWTGIILAIVCLMQLSVGLWIDNRFEKGIIKMFFWLIWYPCIYWVLNAMVTIVGFPKAMMKKSGTKAIWESPDRGL